MPSLRLSRLLPHAAYWRTGVHDLICAWHPANKGPWLASSICYTPRKFGLASVSADSQRWPKPAFQRNRVAGIPSGVTVSVLGCLRLTLLTRRPRYGGLDTAGTPRRAAAMPAGAIEPDERPAGGASNIGGWLLKSSCTTDKSNSRGAMHRSKYRQINIYCQSKN